MIAASWVLIVLGLFSFIFTLRLTGGGAWLRIGQVLFLVTVALGIKGLMGN